MNPFTTGISRLGQRLSAPALAVVAAIGLFPVAAVMAAGQPMVADGELVEAAKKVEMELIAKFGEGSSARIRRGIGQVRSFWRTEDGDAEAFKGFVREQFVADPKLLDVTFDRFEFLLESFDGHVNEIRRDFQRQLDLDLGPIEPIDGLFGDFSPGAHFSEDAFSTKVAFAALLNFPLTSLDERLKQGPEWTRRQWAEARLARRFARRIPAPVQQEIDKAFVAGGNYIASYNIFMHHLLTPNGKRLFPEGLRLLSHWNLRDELKANYSEKDGLAKQKMIQLVMEKIVRQEVPAAVVDNPLVDWTPATGTVVAAPPTGEKVPPGKSRPAGAISTEFEGDARYARLLAIFRAQRGADAYSPNVPTFIARRYEDDREIPEARVRQLLEEVLTSPSVPKVARLIEQRLGRKLEPFDIWYNGFRARGAYTEEELDRIVRAKYPTTAAFQADLPKILRGLGFAPETADFLATKITVDPARGSGHAMAGERRDDNAHLRTRIPDGGMNYKGYNIAIHELGHNVEQVFSLNRIDHWFLKGVPNNAFTEALAFVFQARDMELLGLAKPSAEAKQLAVLNDFWGTYEIAGVGLVDTTVWHWMYDHPDATPAQLREATLGIAKDVWNRFYAPVFGRKDSVILAIYSHMISSGLYLPDYGLGHLIAFQIERQFEGKNLGAEFERVTRQGQLTPDFWMRGATGAPVSTKPILDATAEAVKAMGAKGK